MHHILLLFILSVFLYAETEQDSVTADSNRICKADSTISKMIPPEILKLPPGSYYDQDSLYTFYLQRCPDSEMIIKMPSDYRQIEPKGFHKNVTPDMDPKILKDEQKIKNRVPVRIQEK